MSLVLLRWVWIRLFLFSQNYLVILSVLPWMHWFLACVQTYRISFIARRLICISKIQLVVHYQRCVLIGWATTSKTICYSPLVAKSSGAWKPKKCQLNRVLLAKVVLSRYFWPTGWIWLKQLFLSPSPPLSQYPIRPSASWVIVSEPIRARGIIVN